MPGVSCYHYVEIHLMRMSPVVFFQRSGLSDASVWNLSGYQVAFSGTESVHLSPQCIFHVRTNYVRL